MRALFILVTLTILPIGLVLLGISDTRISIDDTSVPNDEVASGVGNASNSSASATIIITMTGALNK